MTPAVNYGDASPDLTVEKKDRRRGIHQEFFFGGTPRQIAAAFLAALMASLALRKSQTFWKTVNISYAVPPAKVTQKDLQQEGASRLSNSQGVCLSDLQRHTDATRVDVFKRTKQLMGSFCA